MIIFKMLKYFAVELWPDLRIVLNQTSISEARYLHVKKETLINIPIVLDELNKTLTLDW
jgi:hypothetical protein